MPPKAKKDDDESVTMKDILSELTAIKSRLDKVDALEIKLDNLKTKLDEMSNENASIKKENQELKNLVTTQASTINELREGQENVERHQRSWSVRVLNLPLTQAEEKDNLLTMKKAYDLLFEPILNGAREQGVIRQGARG